MLPVFSDIAPAPPAVPTRLAPRPPLWVNELLGDAPHTVITPDGVTMATTAGFGQFTTSIERASSLTPEALRHRVTEAYVAIGEAMGSRRQHPIRFWNFVPGPGDPLGPGLDRYMAFNAGRHDAYARWYGTPRAFSHALATASAVGVQGTDLVIVCLAAQVPGIPIENPRQTSSWQYSTRYGPKPPCFARATIVTHSGERRLLIGGTASIVGEDSTHLGDPIRQVEETVANLSALIAAAKAVPGARRAAPIRGRFRSDVEDISRLRDVRVYVANADDAALIRAQVVASFPGMTRLEMTLSQICRPELLVEIEGIAVL
jgi:chorismate lyase/3-hydroxybenzoate synthase